MLFRSLAGALFLVAAAAVFLAFFPRLKAASQPVAYLAFVPMRVIVIFEASGMKGETAGVSSGSLRLSLW